MRWASSWQFERTSPAFTQIKPHRWFCHRTRRSSPTPGTRKARATGLPAFKAHGQTIADEDVADIPAINTQNAAAPTEIAIVCALRSRSTGTGDKAQLNLICGADHILQTGGCLLTKSKFPIACGPVGFRGVEADKACAFPGPMNSHCVAIGDPEIPG